MAFVAPLPVLSARTAPALRASAPRMSAHSPAPLSRRSLLSGAGVAAAAAILSAAAPANAGLESAFSRSIFPKEGFNAPGSVAPGSVTLDKDVVSSPEWLDALQNLKAFSSTIKQTGKDFEAAPRSFDIAAALKPVKIDELRSVLNVVGEAFDEETQKTTDKVVRGIIQDIGELTYNGAVKAGAVRTDKKIDRIRGWMTKIDGDVDYLLGFSS